MQPNSVYQTPVLTGPIDQQRLNTSRAWEGQKTNSADMKRITVGMKISWVTFGKEEGLRNRSGFGGLEMVKMDSIMLSIDVDAMCVYSKESENLMNWLT